MNRYASLIDVLFSQRDTPRSVRIINGENDELAIGFNELWMRAESFLGVLQDRGVLPGDELIVVSKSNEDFLIAFWGAVLGGIVPVPVAVGISDEHRAKLFRIAGQLKNPTIFTDEDLLQRFREFAADHNLSGGVELLDNRCLTDVDVISDTTGRVYSPSLEELAFVQYSSGSTSDPKGVCLTHGNMTSTLAGQVAGLKFESSDVALSWMPLTHDMGLIGYHITMLAAGIDHAIMDTSVFVRRPLLWLSKASEHRATILCSPNFGYKHYLKMFERKPPDNMDLSCVRLLLNGAEPISIDLCNEFLAALAPFGLKRHAMFPVYGLAEATLAVTFPELGKAFSYITVRRHSLRIGMPFEAAQPADDDAVKFMKLGKAIAGCEYRITDDSDQPLADGCVGNIQLHGENITDGIYRDAETTASVMTADGWLRTGDCGTITEGELVITGRAKDIIIVNGQNYYPHDIEEIIGQLEGFELGKVVVGGGKRPGRRVEELLVFVLHRKEPELLQSIARDIRDIVGKQAGLEVDHVIPVKRIPKTTSGKVQRAILINEYLDGEFDGLLSTGLTVVDSVPALDPNEDPLIAELVGICAEFSKERVVGPDDNLFEVGLSSLTLTEIMLAVDEKYPAAVDINDLFDHPTIRELAAFLASRK